jgi:hypothetical protein
MPAKQTSSRGGGRRYGDAASKSVESAMHRRNEGTLRSGKVGRGGRVKSREQAIAIGLSEARKKGAKVPPPPDEHGEKATAGYLGHEEDAGEAMANEGTSGRPRKRSTSRKGAARRKTASKRAAAAASRKRAARGRSTTTRRKKASTRRPAGSRRKSAKSRPRMSRSMS